ncbi:MAG: hypothetical protein LQ338_004832 [Usnochroma carphineum]|nr:MAG: hypothetical protein LQ338_004832 [Usnochroma carphineum]
MSIPEPDLERGHGRLKVPANPFAPSSPPSQLTTPANGMPQQHRTGNPLMNDTKPQPQSLSRNRRSQHIHPSKIAHDPDAVPPKLQKLRTVIGISTPEALAATSKNPFARPAPNLGIYARIVAEEKVARFQFYFAASVINTCYFGQIVVAAALTALGASSSSHVAITVLGATNTVIAGILTYLKGQGLPNRLRMYWNGLRKCREFIEEKERECAAEGGGWDGELPSDSHSMDVEREIEVIVRMYHDVRQTAEDTYLPMQGHSAHLLASRAGPGPNNSTPGVEKPTGSANGSIRYPEDEIYDSDHDDEHHDDDAHPSVAPVSKPAGGMATIPSPPAAKASASTGSTIPGAQTDVPKGK